MSERLITKKMPASNQEPGIFLWLLLEGERGKDAPSLYRKAKDEYLKIK